MPAVISTPTATPTRAGHRIGWSRTSHGTTRKSAIVPGTQPVELPRSISAGRSSRVSCGCASSHHDSTRKARAATPPPTPVNAASQPTGWLRRVRTRWATVE
ncbi:hypothetical protein [Nocardioides daphniae]|uniref:hypothetical protein n=1 Tax=Nocardioides daphniae TaxID=402297 RepID=UPI0019310E29|nr:hypothetical protein [Nocardioides daphniae]